MSHVIHTPDGGTDRYWPPETMPVEETIVRVKRLNKALCLLLGANVVQSAM
ncbi:hypothetical protein LW347_12005 [Pectobacterium polonicum]|uniref:Uncharacterized protein n=1 Tax=Pectobacterium polonicum TaxID=2485124 RepID=A0AAE9NKE4_9GAMM|nr:hypothetical protein [Pectobacterium polonicum]UVO06659.1 hypothetical protein LW347_12005 [Pectobacterium polonicum]